MPDASAVMQLLLKTQTDFNDLEDDDPQVGTPTYGPPSSQLPPLPPEQSVCLCDCLFLTVCVCVFLIVCLILTCVSDLLHDLSVGAHV